MLYFPINPSLIILYQDHVSKRKIFFDGFCELRVTNIKDSPISILNEEFASMKRSCRRYYNIHQKKIILRTFYNTWVAGYNPLER